MQGSREARAFRAARARAFAALALTVVSTVAAASGVDITSSGTPTYSASISVPPGIAGLAPSLVVTHVGAGVNGPLGYGWSLQGTSMITRCQGSIATSGRAIAVAFSTLDRLCLDGQRLIQTNASGTPVASTPAINGTLADAAGRAEDGSATEYRTENDSFARIRAYGMANGAVANGPRYFKVWTKSGQVMEFGSGPSDGAGNSQALLTAYGLNIAAAWGVSRISDTLGNFIDFKYNKRNVTWGSVRTYASGATGQEWNLAEIQYTGFGSQAPANKIVFEYTDRPDTPGAAQDRSEAYHANAKTVSVRRLKAIRSYVNWPGPALGTDVNGVPLAAPTTAVKVKVTKFNYNNGASTGRSRLTSIQDCVGATENSCMPATSFSYNDGTTAAYTPSATFAAALGNTTLMTADGKMGVVVGDFDGNGHSDILRYSDTPSLNVLYLSQGHGSFSTTSTNLTAADDFLFRSDGCYWSILADFNGDGKTDILRVMRATSNANASCGTLVNRLYLSQGNGQFTKVNLPSNIDLTQLLGLSGAVQVPHCSGGNRSIGVGAPMTATGAATTAAAPTATTIHGPVSGGGSANPDDCTYTYVFSRTAGKNFHIIDVNGDGFPDIVTSSSSAYSGLTTYPGADYGCSTCTHVYLGSASGTFTEKTDTNIAQHVMYAVPSNPPINPYLVRPYVLDFDGDGLSDLIVDSGAWRSNGDGNFTFVSGSANLGSCQVPIDFNGDGAQDCLQPYATAAATVLHAGDGSLSQSVISNYNLTAVGQELTGATLGMTAIDVDNDGRTDMIRWEDDPTKNVVYLSNGDGTFRVASQFNLNTADYALKKSDGTKDFIVGDFTGDGNVEILRLVASPSGSATATTNQLFVKANVMQPDLLSKVTTPSGITHTLTWVTLADSSSGAIGARYHDAASFGPAATYPLIDLTLPMWVVATVTSQTGVGSATINTEYAYGGMRAALDGRGMLGFMKMSEQHVAPDNTVTRLDTNYLQALNYIGSAGLVQSFDAGIGVAGHLLSETTSAYCDTTSTAALPTITTPGVAPTPCASTALIKRPYLYQTVAEGWDIDAARTALPTVTTTNVYDAEGNPTSIVATTTGQVVGSQQTATKTVTNTYSGEDISGDHWVLNRLQGATVRNVVANGMAQIATAPGTSPHAADRQGPTPSVNIPAVMSVIMSVLLSD